jgi:hypothetical protein
MSAVVDRAAVARRRLRKLQHDLVAANEAVVAGTEAAERGRVVHEEAARRLAELESAAGEMEQEVIGALRNGGIATVSPEMAQRRLDVVAAGMAVEIAEKVWQQQLLDLAGLHSAVREAEVEVTRAINDVIRYENDGVANICVDLERVLNAWRSVLASAGVAYLDDGEGRPRAVLVSPSAALVLRRSDQAPNAFYAQIYKAFAAGLRDNPDLDLMDLLEGDEDGMPREAPRVKPEDFPPSVKWEDRAKASVGVPGAAD